MQLAAQSLVFPDTEDLGDHIGRQAEDSELAGALEDLVNREMAAKHQIPAVLNLVEGVRSAQLDRRPLLLGELRPEHQRPVVEPLANDLGVEPVGRRLQRVQIGRPQKGVIVLAEPDAAALEFAGDDVVSVEVVGGLEREEGPDTHHERPDDLVPDVEVIMGVARTLSRHDPVVRVVGGVLRDADAELRPLLQALEDEVHPEPVLPLHLLTVGSDIVFFLELLRREDLGVRPLDWECGGCAQTPRPTADTPGSVWPTRLS